MGNWAGRGLARMTGAAEAARLANEEQRNAQLQGEESARAVDRVRTGFGSLLAKDRTKAMTNRAGFGSAIEGNVGAFRDVGLASLTDNATQAANQAADAAARSGMFGGSVDEANKRGVVAQYGAGRAGLGLQVGNARESAVAGLDQNRMQMEQAVRANQAQGAEQMYAAGRSLSSINAARANVPLQTFGNMLGTVGTGLATAAVQGAAQPKIPGASTSATGGGA